jgi:TolA-binding protein
VSELEAKDIQMRDKVTNLESKVTELEAKDFQMQIKVAQQDSLLSDLLREKNERTAAANRFEYAPMRSNESAVAINGLPSSCGDLKMIGHTLNGFYSVMGSAMMESVYCDFSKLPSDPGK